MSKPTHDTETNAPEKPAKNYATIAEALGVTVRSITNWREKFPDAPQTMLVSDWQAFKKRRKLGFTNNRVGKDRESILVDKAAAETRLIRIKIAKEERKLIDAELVENFHLFAAARLKSAIYQLFATELPPKTANSELSDVRKINREACDALCLSMQATFDQWREEQEAARAAAAAVEDNADDEDE